MVNPPWVASNIENFYITMTLHIAPGNLWGVGKKCRGWSQCPLLSSTSKEVTDESRSIFITLKYFVFKIYFFLKVNFGEFLHQNEDISTLWLHKVSNFSTLIFLPKKIPGECIKDCNLTSLLQKLSKLPVLSNYESLMVPLFYSTESMMTMIPSLELC